MANINGIVNVFKPPGPTSSDIVVGARRLFGLKKIGHLGTLDPGAAGVLPLCLGDATRLFDLLVDKRKTYLAEMVFGVETDTQDAFGSVIGRSDGIAGLRELQAILPDFTGNIEQIPSAYSAIKSGGKRMYELAREGENVEIKPRSVTIDELDVIEQTGVNRFLIRVACSRGTYIRSLVSDMGKALGVCAHMGMLVRTQNGSLRVEDSHTLDEIKALIDVGRVDEIVARMDDVLAFLPEAHAPKERLLRFFDGLGTNIRYIEAERELQENERYRLYCGNEFLGVGTLRDGEMKLAIRIYNSTENER